MTSFMVFLITVAVIVIARILIQVFNFIKFCVLVNKLPGPARYPMPTVALQVKKLKQEGMMLINQQTIVNYYL